MAKALEFTSLDFFDEKDTLIALSFSSIDFREIGKRKGSFSKTVKMPSTKKNDAFFGYSFEVSSESHFDPLIKIPIKITEINFFGTLKLKSVDLENDRVQSYSVNIFGDLANWVSLIGQGTLRELTHHGSHTLSKQTIKDSWNNTGLSGDFVYPLISYGNFLQDGVPQTNVVISQVRPAFFVLPLIRQIFKEVGFTFIDTDIKNSKFRDTILPYTSKEMKVVKDLLLVEADRENETDILNDFRNDNIAVSVVSIDTILFENEIVDNENLFNLSSSTYVAPATDRYTVFISINVDFNIGASAQSLLGTAELGLRHTSVLGIRVFPISATTQIRTGGPNSGRILFKTESIQLATDDTLQLVMITTIEPPRFAGSPNILSSITMNSGFMSINPLNATLTTGGVIDHALNVQNIKKIDLLTEILNFGNFRIVTNNDDNTVEFIQEENFLLNETEDWTDKLDQSKKSTISLIQNNGAKELEWNFQNDTDDNILQDSADRNDIEWGRKRVQLQSEYRKGSQIIKSSIFSATIDGTGRGLRLPVMSTQDIPEDGIISAGAFETNFENRILIYDGLRTGGWTLDGELQSEYPFSYFVTEDFSLQWDNISDLLKPTRFTTPNQDQGLVDRFYTKVIERLNNSKILSAWFYLTEKDISDLNFRKSKTVNGVQYYLNKVKDYKLNTNRPTRVELISK